MKNTIRIWGSVLALLLVAAIIFSPVSGDAPFYLGIARDISNGIVPYRDVALGYTPLTMYLNSVLCLVFSHPDYWIFLFFQFVIIAFSGFLLYKIAVKEGLSETKSLLLVIFFSICTLSSDGSYINLEVYNIFFTLAAYWLLLQKKYLYTGVLLSLTFFCKQYGILNFVPFLLLVFATESKYRNVALFCIGGLIPLLFFLIYFSGFQHIQLQELLAQLSGKGYGEKNLTENKTILNVLSGAKVFLLLSLPLVFLKFNPLHNKKQLALSVGVLVALLPVFVQSFQHYFLNAFPYVILLIALNWKENELNLWTLHISMGIVSIFLALRIYNFAGKAKIQKQVAIEMANFYPKGTTIYLKGTINYLYILNDYRNPALKEIGYGYAFKPDQAFLEKNIVLCLERIPNQVPTRISNVSGTKIYEY